ncbi:hypothetical protein C1646_664873 [Rhizophagus diaphanus]|nr:hypothetical protein C1646_664873 [Rhizophagus diaphanus] [Rhizophagus sp. MUCL 43196]
MSMFEPQVIGKHSKFMCEQRAHDIDDFFKSKPASKWSFELYINNFLADLNLDVTFDQLLSTFVDSLDQMNQPHTVPLTIRSKCSSYLKWLQLSTGKALVSTCREVFDAKIDLEKKFRLNSVFKKITAQTRGFKALLQPVPPEMKLSPSVFLSEMESSPSVFSSEAEAEPSPSVFPSEAELSSPPVFYAPDALPPKTPPQTHRKLTHLLNTPNKRPIEKEELWPNWKRKLVELTKELSSIRDRNPAIWNPALEQYINTTIKESGDKFKDVV